MLPNLATLYGKIAGPAPNSRSKSEVQNLVYSPAIDAGTRPGTADPDGA